MEKQTRVVSRRGLVLVVMGSLVGCGMPYGTQTEAPTEDKAQRARQLLTESAPRNTQESAKATRLFFKDLRQ